MTPSPLQPEAAEEPRNAWKQRTGSEQLSGWNPVSAKQLKKGRDERGFHGSRCARSGLLGIKPAKDAFEGGWSCGLPNPEGCFTNPEDAHHFREDLRLRVSNLRKRLHPGYNVTLRDRASPAYLRQPFRDRRGLALPRRREASTPVSEAVRFRF